MLKRGNIFLDWLRHSRYTDQILGRLGYEDGDAGLCFSQCGTLKVIIKELESYVSKFSL